MPDIPLKDALLLWDLGWDENGPRFAVRPLGHDDYYHYGSQNGACMADWQRLAEQPAPALLAKTMAELWHIAAFYTVPIAMIHEAMLCVPEYRNMLAEDCLPSKYQHQRI